MPLPSVLRPDRTKFFVLLETVRAAGTYISEEVAVPAGAKTLALLSKFTYGAGGTTLKVFLQTSLDGGRTWVDIANHAYVITTASKLSAVKTDIATAAGATPGDGALADNTILDGVLGDRVRVKQVVAGTYTTTTLEVSGVFN